MRVLLTGATGFVGSHVARLLARSGHDVHAMVLPGADEEARLAERLGAEKISLLRADLLAPASYRAALAHLRPEACLHLAWYANPRDYLSARVNIDLVGASAALGTSLVEAGCRRIVMTGTCFEYDTALGYLAESSALAPRHLYSTCKRSLFDIMRHLVDGTDTSFAWARLFFLYGPHESDGRLVPAVIDALLAGERARVTTGEQYRDFMHVADAAASLVHLLEANVEGPVNVASGVPVRVRDVVSTIARELAGEDRIDWGAIAARPNDPAFVCADTRKLVASGAPVPRALEDGIRDTIAWRRERSAVRSVQ